MIKSGIKCPYCVEGSGFKVMPPISGGDWHQCERCAHIVFPNDPLFTCTCQNCAKLGRSVNAPPDRRSPRSLE